MSGSKGIPPKDLERLSAYLDRALSPSEMAEVEARLRTDPDFRRAQEELRQVVVAVRNLGELRVPRNFTLRPDQVSRRATFGYPGLRLATALASALFMLTCGLQVLQASTRPVMQLAAAPVSEYPQEPPAAVALDELAQAEREAAAPAEAPPPDELAGTAAPMGAAVAQESQPLPTPTIAATQLAKSDDQTPLPSAAESEVAELEGEPDLAPTGADALAQETRIEDQGATVAFPWLAAVSIAAGLAAVVLFVLTLRARPRG